MKVGIYGAGSLGTILGAYLTKGGIPVDLINRNKVHVDALNENGAHITGTVDFTQRVHAILPEEMPDDYDVIFLMTKQLANKEVVTLLAPKLSRDGVICTLQNGLPEPAIAEIVGEDKVLGCVVEWGATLVSPGVSELTSEPDSLSFELGRMNGVIDDTVKNVKAILEHMCPVSLESNFMGVRWSKLLINAAFSGVSTVVGTTFGQAAKDKRSRKWIQGVIKECIDVAAAANIKIAPVQGKDIVALLNYDGKIRKWVSFKIIPIAIKKHADLTASMLQDIHHGKKTEVDYINGVVADYGKKVGVPTPYNDGVVRIIHEIEGGTKNPGFQNL